MASKRILPRGTGLVLLVAVMLRIVACWYWFDDLNRDPDGYAVLAAHLAAGEGYVSPDGTPTAFRPPLYPIWLAALSAGGPVALAAGQIVLGVATVALTCAIGGWFGLKRFALLAGLIVAFDPLLLRYAPQVMTETICAFLAILMTAAVALQQQTIAAARQERGGRLGIRVVAVSFGLGIVIGLAALARPTFWAVIALLFADGCLRHLWRRLRKRNQSPPVSRSASLPVAIVVLGLVLTTAPWAIRNAITLGQPFFTTTHGGYTLLLANNPVFWQEVVMGGPGATWERESLADWQAKLEREMSEAGIAPSNELARDRWLQARAIANIKSHPLMFIRASIYRQRRFWALGPLDPSGTTPLTVSAFVSIFYGVVFVLAACGLVACWRSVGDGLWTTTATAVVWRSLLWIIVAFVVVHSVYWTDTRMRAPVIPAVALFAGRGGKEVWRICRAIFHRNSSFRV